MIVVRRQCCALTLRRTQIRKNAAAAAAEWKVMERNCWSGGFWSSRRCLSSSVSSERQSDHAFCVDLVQKRDKEGYLCGLLMPAKSRESYFAIRALNVELASIKDGGGLYGQRRKVESNMMMNELEGGNSNLALKLRMQWWRDAIFQKDNSTTATSMPSSSTNNNPIVRSMHRAMEQSQLTNRFIERMMDARELDLDWDQFHTMSDLIQYSEDTYSSLLYLQLECCHHPTTNHNDQQHHHHHNTTDLVASHVGIALGIVTAIRSIVYRSTVMGEIAIPADLLQKYNLSQNQFFNTIHHQKDNANNNDDQSLQAAVQEMAQIANQYLAEARRTQAHVPKQARPALLPAVIGIHYLQTLQNTYKYDIFHPHKQRNENQMALRLENLRLTMLLGRAWLTGIF